MKLKLPAENNIHFITIDNKPAMSLREFLRTVYPKVDNFYISDRANRAWESRGEGLATQYGTDLELNCFGAGSVKEAQSFWSNHPKATCYRTSQLVTSVYGEL